MVIANTVFKNTRDDFTYGHHQIANMGIKLITFFVAENEEVVYKNKILELTLAQVFSLS